MLETNGLTCVSSSIRIISVNFDENVYFVATGSAICMTLTDVYMNK